MHFAGDAEAIARDEDAVEDGGAALGVERDALGSERGHAGTAAEVARFASAETDGGDGLAGSLDGDSQLELERLTEWRALEIGLEQLLAEAAGQERPLEPDRMAVDEAEPVDHEHARAAA